MGVPGRKDRAPGGLRLAALCGAGMWAFEVALATQTRVCFRLVPSVGACLAAYLAVPLAAAFAGGLAARGGDVERGRLHGLAAGMAALALAGFGLFVYLELTPVPLRLREGLTAASLLGVGLVAWLAHRRWRPAPDVAARLSVVLWCLSVCLYRAPRTLVLDVVMSSWGFVARDALRALLIAGACVASYPLIGFAWRRPLWALAVALPVAPLAVYAVVPPRVDPVVPSKPPRGDVYFIVLDSLRYDYTSLAPDGGDATPALAGLAARGLSFSEAHSPSNETTYSLPLLMGRYEGKGRAQLKTRWNGVRGTWSRSLPARMQAAGYHVHLLSDCAYMALEGLEVYQWDTVAARSAAWFRLTGLAKAWGAIFERDSNAMNYILGDRQPYPDGEGPADELDRVLAADPTPGFFLIHLAAPHDPYDRPPYRARTLPPVDREAARPALERYGYTQSEVPAADAAVYRTFYRRAVRAADEHLAAMLATIARHGRDRDALIIVTADHGESLGEAGYVGHGLSLHVYEHHVPLVMVARGVPAGRVVQRPVSNGRLADTILDWAGVSGGDSRSLFAELVADGPTQPVVVWTPVGVSVQDEGWRLLWTRDDIVLHRRREWAHRRPFELYDVAGDPGERRDRYAPDNPRVRDLLDIARTLGRPLATETASAE
jgi:arylsulfatase A-like enzyme